MKLHTQLVQFDAAPQDPFGPTATPVYQTATFEQEDPEQFGRYDYSRSGNPTRDVLQRQLARLEHARHGFAFASGLAAITAVLGLLSAGDEVVAGDDLYGGTFRLFGQIAPRRGLAVRYGDPTEPEVFAELIGPKTRLVHVETPTNPLLRIVDLARLSAAVRRRAAGLGIESPIISVDNTLASPYLQNPLDHGADVVVHSATKALCGHADVTAGAVCCSREEIARQIAFVQNAEGAGLGPQDCFLLLRGLKTLGVRIAREQQTAAALAEEHEEATGVEEVYSPGLAGHAGREVHAAQSRGPGSIISLRLGSRERAVAVAKALELFPTTVSFGSVSSSVCFPAAMSHASVPRELRARVAPPEDLLRLSIGLEDVDDLRADLRRAIALAEADQTRLITCSTGNRTLVSLPNGSSAAR